MTIKLLILKLLEYRILIAADWEKAEQRTEEQSWGETEGECYLIWINLSTEDNWS